MRYVADINTPAFSSSEVEAVTGLSQVMQRDWRRHRYLSSAGGKRTKTTLLELAETLTMRLLAEQGIGPSAARQVASVVAPSVLRFAMDEKRAWSISGDASAIRAFRDFFSSGDGPPDVMRAIGCGSQDVHLYLVMFSDGSHSATSDLQEVFGRDQPTAVVVNVEALGRRIARMSPVPIFVVSVSEWSGSDHRPDGVVFGDGHA